MDNLYLASSNYECTLSVILSNRAVAYHFLLLGTYVKILQTSIHSDDNVYDGILHTYEFCTEAYSILGSHMHGYSLM